MLMGAWSACFAPRLVGPDVLRQVPDDRGSARAQLGGVPVGIGLVDTLARKARLDAVLVERALADGGHEALPDAGRSPLNERRSLLVPAVELTDDADRIGIRRPHGELHPGLAGARNHVRPELRVDADVGALIEEVEIEFRQQAIRIARVARGARGWFSGLHHDVSSTCTHWHAPCRFSTRFDGSDSLERSRRSRALPES
jgi:hypothetical protein